MTFVLGRQHVNSQTCADVQTLARQVATVIEALGNPGPPLTPTDDPPCGTIISPAYVRDASGTPTLSYVDANDVCQDLSTGGGGGTTPNILWGTVDSAVTPANPEFTVTVGDVVTGTETNATVTFVNVYNTSYSPGDYIFGVMRSDDKYVPDRDEAATSTGDTFTNATLVNSDFLVHFELTQDMTRSQTERLAIDLSSGNTIYVLDPHQEFFGKASYTDSSGTYDGLKGYGVRFAADHSGGTPSYRIITMEGWKRFLVCQCVEDVATDDTTFNVDIDEGYASHEHGGRTPPIANASYDLTVEDPYNLVSTASTGDKVLVGLEDADDGSGGPTYHVLQYLEQPKFIRIKGQTVSDVDRTAATFSMDNVEAVIGQNPTDALTDTVTIVVSDGCKVDIPANTEIYAIWDRENDYWSVGDGANWYWIARGRVGFDSTKYQVLTNQGNTESDMEWVEAVSETVVVNLPTITLSQTATELVATLDYDTRDIRIVEGGAVTARSSSDSLTTTACP